MIRLNAITHTYPNIPMYDYSMDSRCKISYVVTQKIIVDQILLDIKVNIYTKVVFRVTVSNWKHRTQLF